MENKTDILEIMKKNETYYSEHKIMPTEDQKKAKMLCYEYNQTSPMEDEKRKKILKKLFGTCHELTFIEPDFHCDYGFNIHTHGLTFINYNCVILDTSPVDIGAGTFIGPGTCIACAGHAIHPIQRAEGIGYSKPVTIGEKVWIGANVTVCGGVHIGNSSIIGGGSVVTKDIPDNVVAAGNPCKVIREITEDDLIEKGRVIGM